MREMSAVDGTQANRTDTCGHNQEQPAARSSQAKPKSWLAKVPVGAENIKFGPKRVENRRFGPKQRPNESYGLSGPIWTTPEAKN